MGDKVPFVGRLRPDLIDFANKQIYEIKTVLGFSEGQVQLTGYLLILNWADQDKSRPWTRGTIANYRPPPSIPLGTGAFALVSPSVKGVITYDVVDLKVVAAALVAVAVMSMNLQGAQLGAQFATASLIVTMGGF